ncbi:MAG: response regulator [Cyanobacteriota bacterium]|nr:response regulator [Cyanobacteriota bacterium]
MSDARMINAKANILIVDDQPDNLRVLSTMLRVREYRVRGALNADLALQAAQTKPPDLILLDIMMPGVNGYELCHQLKNHPTTCEIPVIFISALDRGFDKAKAFQVGGADYITKPFQIEEAIARIEHQLTIVRLQKQLERQNIQLQQEVKVRKQVEAKVRRLNAALEARIFERTLQLEAANQDIFKEINENKNLEQKLRVKKAQIKALMGAITDIVLILDEEAQQIEVMPTPLSQIDKTHAASIEKTIAQFACSPQAEEFTALIKQAVASQTILNFEYSIPADGEITLWFSASISPVPPLKMEGIEETPRAIWIARDITLLKQAEAQVEQLQQRASSQPSQSIE